MRYFLFTLLLVSTSAVAQLNAGFSASVTQGCAALTVGFNDQSTGSPAKWFWDFGNGLTSVAQNPTVNYYTPGIYTVRLTVKNATGQDYEEKTNYIRVFPASAPGFTANIDSGCFPLQVLFTDSTDISNINVRSWLWNFGDGTTSSQQNPRHVFTTEGSFDVSLTIETTDGCSNTILKTGVIRTGSNPVADFTASPLNGCALAIRSFNNISTAGITSSSWDFGDGITSNEESPSHHFQDTGWITIKLTVTKNGCKDTVEKIDYIHVSGPVARINKIVNCEDSLTLIFRDYSIGEESTTWDLGDGTTSTRKTTIHTYATTGDYQVKLSVSNATCTDTSSTNVHISSIYPVAEIVPPQNFYCKNDSLQFRFTTYDTISANAFAWNFGNGDSLDYNLKNDTLLYAYPANGSFLPVAFFRDKDRCIDTIMLNTITIRGVTAGFENPVAACTNTRITFTDRSVVDGGPITEWLWKYGDGTVLTDTIPFTYNYSFPGTYNVKLTVTDANGCTDIISNPLIINEAPVVEVEHDKLLCAGQTDTLTATGATTYSWRSNGNIICNSCINPVVSPTVTTVYYVTGTNQAGCSASDSSIISVQSKQEITLQPSQTSVCAGGSVQLTAAGTNTYLWSPASGLNNTAIANPVASPAVSTVYTVTGKDSNACFGDTATVNIVINPLPSVDIPVNSITIPPGSTYQLQATASEDVRTWQWAPMNDLSCYTCPDPLATVNGSITYILTVTNGNGCSSKDSITFVTVCSSDLVFIPNTFSPNSNGMNDYFFPNSKTPLTVNSMRIFNRWGQKIFEKKNFLTNNSNDGWNGRYHDKEQGADVYIYVMELQCTDGSKIMAKGNVSLVR